VSITTCAICTSSQRISIEADLRAGMSTLELTGKYGIHLTDISRHVVCLLTAKQPDQVAAKQSGPRKRGGNRGRRR
jgi:hypothetical protein